MSGWVEESFQKLKKVILVRLYNNLKALFD